MHELIEFTKPKLILEGVKKLEPKFYNLKYEKYGAFYINNPKFSKYYVNKSGSKIIKNINLSLIFFGPTTFQMVKI